MLRNFIHTFGTSFTISEISYFGFQENLRNDTIINANRGNEIRSRDIKMKGSDDLNSDMSLNWTCAKFSDKELQIQIEFINPNALSIDEYDVVKVYFYGSIFFTDLEGNTMEYNSEFKVPIPRQIDQNTAELVH